MLLQYTQNVSGAVSGGRKPRADSARPLCHTGRQATVQCKAVYTNERVVTATAAPKTLSKDILARDPDLAEKVYLASRAAAINSYFPGTLAVHDFIQRVDIALSAYGFDGNNSIAMTNLCRDEVTATLRHEIENIFGASFNTNGLGAVLTCGVTGIKAGLSHAPICSSGRERYVFFSFPHISIDATGKVGAISRPGRAGESCACGALIGALGSIKETGMQAACKRPGVHDALDPELSILKQRLARRMRWEGWTESQVKELDLVDITKVAERTITDDLKYLIQHTVDPSKADYAVVTGVEVHNYGATFDNDDPNLEFIWPTNCYVVINGEKTYLDLDSIPALPARQIQLLSGSPPKIMRQSNPISNTAGTTTVRSIDAPFLYSTPQELQEQKQRAAKFAAVLDGQPMPAALDGDDTNSPMWKANLTRSTPFRAESDNSSIVDLLSGGSTEIDALTEEFMDRIKVLAAKKMAAKKMH